MEALFFMLPQSYYDFDAKCFNIVSLLCSILNKVFMYVFQYIKAVKKRNMKVIGGMTFCKHPCEGCQDKQYNYSETRQSSSAHDTPSLC